MIAGVVGPEGRTELPPEVAGRIPPGEHLQVVLFWRGSSGDDAEWLAAAGVAFDAAYAPEDSVYDQLIP